MNIIKKLCIVTIGVLLITISSNSTVRASEIGYSENTDEVILTIDEESSLAEEPSDAEENLEEIADADYELSEEEIDLDKYEIYVDEQGQVYYIEKKTADSDSESEKAIQENNEKNEKSNSAKKEKNKNQTEKPSYSEKDLRLLACLIYAEAGNQSYEGMLAVANVVLNRVKSPIFAHVNTIEEVIYDNKWGVQFSVIVKNSKTGKSILDKAFECYDTGKFPGKNPEAERKCMNRAIKAAKAALCGENNIGDFLYFRANNSSAASIKKKYDYKIIGDHIFYRTK